MLIVDFWIGGNKVDCNGTKHFEYTFNKKCKVNLDICEKKITVSIDPINYKAFQDAWRRAVLIYRMNYNADLDYEIDVRKNDKNVTGDEIKEWIGNTFLKKGFDSALGDKWKDKAFIKIIEHNTKSDILKNPAFVSMYNYLAAKTKKYSMDKFLYMWMAVNGYYNALTWISLGETGDKTLLIKESAKKESLGLDEESCEKKGETIFDDPDQSKDLKIIQDIIQDNTQKYNKILDLWIKEEYAERIYKPKSNFKLGELMDKFYASWIGDYDRISFLENVAAYESGYSEDKPLFFAPKQSRNSYFDESLTLDDKSYEAFSTQIKNLSRNIKKKDPGLKSADVWKIVYDCSLDMMGKQFKMDWTFEKKEEKTVNDLLEGFDSYPGAFIYLTAECSDDESEAACCEKLSELGSNYIVDNAWTFMAAYFGSGKSKPYIKSVVNKVHFYLEELRKFLHDNTRIAEFFGDGDPISSGEAYFLLFLFRNIAILKMNEQIENKDFPLFIMFLFEYPYHWRNQLFHAKRTPALFAIPNDPEIETFDMLNYFLERYLGEKIPVLIKTICRSGRSIQAHVDGDRQTAEWTNVFLKVIMNMVYHNRKVIPECNAREVTKLFLSKIK